MNKREILEKQLEIFKYLILRDIHKSDISNDYVIWDKMVERKTNNYPIIKDKIYNLLNKINTNNEFRNKYLNTNIEDIENIWNEC